ncbi:MAG: nucleoside phosphorylase [Rickettsiales bacterium]|jgi:uridine phosphorylase|nr:nucleoside phosphorylase [Rickettsiales bacterium]
MKKQKFPILEFDQGRDAVIDPRKIIRKIRGMPEYCVLCFFDEAIKKLVKKYPHETVSYFKSDGGIKKPIYKVKVGNKNVCLTAALLGGPFAVGQIEEISAMGCKKFLAVGSCGVIDKEHQYGKLIIPAVAVRDEGASYHYVKPSREISMSGRIVESIEKYFIKNKLPYIKGKTWTTDALYRETKDKIALRKSDGCVSVDMECASYLAAARYNNVSFGQILYAADCIGGAEWNDRKRRETKANVLRTRYELSEHALKIVQQFR